MDEKTTLETEFATEKPYVFRKLSSADVFVMVSIIGKIGVNEFTKCFNNDDFKEIISGAKDNEQATTRLGISMIFEIANVVCNNLDKCEKDIYKLLSQTSNLSATEIRDMDAVLFLGMVIDFVKKDEFPDFIKVVSKLFK